MTLFLASVADPEEAEVAVQQGADIIDLKDAARGALAALSPQAVRQAVRQVAGRRPLSAVTGDLPMEPGTLLMAARAMAGAGVDYVKVGLFSGPARPACIEALAEIAAVTRLVGVMFADDEPNDALLPLMARCGFAGVMLDTAQKGSGGLLAHRDIAALMCFAGLAREHGLMVGLAGSLEAPDVPRLLPLTPDFLGFRGALCARHDRAGRLEPGHVRVIRDLIPTDPHRRSPAATPDAKADYRLLARSYAVDSGKDAPLDRVFVHDLEMPVRIGVYAREHDEPQRVRFNVDVKVARGPLQARDMRHVFSYDLIMDGIRMIVAQGHIPLVETLAERIADLLFAYPRVVEVAVRVEKLDIGPAAVGVEIRRERPAEMAKVYQLYPPAAARAGAAD